MSVDRLNTISELLISNTGNIVFETNGFIAKNNIANIDQTCQAKGIKTEHVAGTLLINLSEFITPNLIYFEQLTTYFEPEFANSTFSIININGEFCYCQDNITGLKYNSTVTEPFKRSCDNVYGYFKLYNFLLAGADHHNDAINEMVLYHAAKGILKIKYDNSPQPYNNINVDKSVNDIINAISLDLRPYFNLELFNFSDSAHYIHIDDIIINSGKIVEAAKRDYELVSKQFDFDKFRDSLIKEKEKYFENIRNVLDKIFGQIIGIPISISASVFATDKVKDDPFVLLLILIAFIIYTVIYTSIQFIYRKELIGVRTDFNRDFDIIQSKSGLPLNIISTEKSKIDKKLSISIRIINLLIGTVLILSAMLIGYILYEFCSSQLISIINHII